MKCSCTELSVSFLLKKEPLTPVNDAVSFMVDTRHNKTEIVLPASCEQSQVPDWIKNPRSNCLRFSLAKETYHDVDCTYDASKPFPVLTFHGIKYNDVGSYVDGCFRTVFDLLQTELKDETFALVRYKAIAKIQMSVSWDKDMLADVIMNDYRLAQYVALCEKTSILSNRRMFSVAVSLEGHSTYVRVALTAKNKSYDDGVEVVAMMSKLPNEESALYVAKIIENMLQTYAHTYVNSGISDYSSFSDAYSNASSLAEGIKQLRAELPELFVNNYTRECPVLPIMVSNEETENLEKIGKRVVLYPKESKYARYYTAPDGYYVGLKRNRLSNKNRFPFLVTCYLLDHMKREGSETHKYYVEPGSTNVIKPVKSRPVPKSIAMLCATECFGETSYHRKRADSFVSALELATTSKIPEGVLPWCPQIAKQEMWDRSDDDIMKIIRVDSCYGQGSNVYRYFEELLKVSIHVIVIINGKFEPLIPRHRHTYIWEPSYSEHVVIFETFKTTYGKTSCSYEYLVEGGSNKSVQHKCEKTRFTQENNIVNSVIKHKMSESQKPRDFGDLELFEQLIDNKGKCREVTTLDGQKIPTFTRPLTIAVTPEQTCFFDFHARKLNAIKLEMGIKPIDLSKRSTNDIIYFPNYWSFEHWMTNVACQASAGVA